MKNYVFVVGAALSLTGCGTSPGVGITASPSDQTTGIVPGGLTASHNATTNEVTLTNGGSSTTVPSSGFINSSFEAFSNVDTRIARGTTPSGGGQVLVLFDDTVPMRGTLTQRLTPTTLPASGSATYSGLSASILISPSGGGYIAAGPAIGSVALQANFGANTISGSVINRITIAGTMADVTLAPTLIDNNADFAGIASGGEFLHTPSTTSGGTYAGQIVGANGTEIVGGFTLNHNDGATDYIELGGFVSN